MDQPAQAVRRSWVGGHTYNFLARCAQLRVLLAARLPKYSSILSKCPLIPANGDFELDFEENLTQVLKQLLDSQAREPN